MPIKTKYIDCETKNAFRALKLPTGPSDIEGDIYWSSIVYIKDTGEVWTHGRLYGGFFSNIDNNKVSLTIGGVEKTLSLDGHTQPYTTLTGSSTTANQAILSTGVADKWTLKTLGKNAFSNDDYLLADATAVAAEKVVNPLTFKYNGFDIHSFDGSSPKTVNLMQGDNVVISGDTQGNITISADSGSDTVNTAGATNLTDRKLFLIGAESQTSSPQTYSNQYVYIGTDNCLYSLGKKVLTEHQTIYNLDISTLVGDVTTKILTFDPNAANNSFTLAQGSNITLTPDASNKKITISSKDTTYDFYNLIFQHGDSVIDTYKPTTSPNKTIKSGSNITISKVDNNIVIASQDTKNTAGSTDNLTTKLFLIGATSQGANPQTFSNSKVFIGTDNKLYSDGKVVSTSDHNHDSTYVTLGTTQTITGAKTFSNPINSSLVSNTHIDGNKGKAIINSTASAGSYTMLFKGNSTNGYFTHGAYQTKYLLQYTAKSTVDAGTNAVTKSVTLLDESGNSYFPGNVSASKFIGALQGNADTATKLTTSAGSASLPIYFSDGKPVACTASSLFSTLSNSGNNISITVAGQNRTLQVNYANSTQYVVSSGNKTAISGTTKPSTGIRLYEVYNNGYPTNYGNLISVAGSTHSGAGELLLSWTNNNRIYYRSIRDTTDSWLGWSTIAFLTDNVASASKLQTARNIWGQSFDGTKDISGNMTGVGTITASGVLDLIGKNEVRLKYNNDNTNSVGLTVNSFRPFTESNNNIDLGISTAKWRNLYLGGSANIGGNATIGGLINIGNSSEGRFNVNNTTLLRWNGSTSKNVILSSTGGIIYIRPNGDTDSNGQVQIDVSGNVIATGFKKNSSSDSYILLGGGGHKAVSDFVTSSTLNNYATLNTAQTISGVKTFSTQQKFTVANGTSPFTVTSSTVVANLNADLLDGIHATSFMRCDGANNIKLTGGNGNTAGWRLVLEKTCGGWTILNSIIAISSRHTGQGTLYIGFHTTNDSGSTYSYSINFKGSTASLTSNPWRAFYNTSTKKFRLFWYYSDYNDTYINTIARNGFDAPKNGTWYETLPSDNGTELTIQYNTATKLQTARQINGTNFDGTANITTTNWGATRSITIGNSTKSVNGSGNVSWTLSEIGAISSTHTHTLSQISDLHSSWDALLKAAPSGYVTRWPSISEVTSKQNLLIKLNGGTTEGTNQFTYNVTSAKTVNITASSIGAAASSHNHGTLHDNFTVTLANTTTDSGWSMINSSYNGFLLKSIRTQASTPNWILNNFAAGICFGGADTKGVLSIAYNTPAVKFAGGNSTKPVWYFGMTGMSGENYNLSKFTTINSLYSLSKCTDCNMYDVGVYAVLSDTKNIPSSTQTLYGILQCYQFAAGSSTIVMQILHYLKTDLKLYTVTRFAPNGGDYTNWF